MARGRPPLVNPTRPLHVHLDGALAARLDLLLWSEVESRVPNGAYQRLFNTLLRKFLEERELDLSPFLGSLPGELVVSGHPETLARLSTHLTSLVEGAPS